MAAVQIYTYSQRTLHQSKAQVKLNKNIYRYINNRIFCHKTSLCNRFDSLLCIKATNSSGPLTKKMYTSSLFCKKYTIIMLLKVY